MRCDYNHIIHFQYSQPKCSINKVAVSVSLLINVKRNNALLLQIVFTKSLECDSCPSPKYDFICSANERGEGGGVIKPACLVSELSTFENAVPTPWSIVCEEYLGHAS